MVLFDGNKEGARQAFRPDIYADKALGRLLCSR